MEGETDKAKRTLAFKDICLIKRDDDNPLSFLVAFRDSTPFHMYLSQIIERKYVVTRKDMLGLKETLT
jgi:hypothetical protein